jgi:TRAP-type mannitol/chloroaromatic compound transport system permease large subunit
VILHGLLPMTVLMLIVLGSIFAGFATATESAGVGCLGTILIAWMNKRFSMTMLREAIRDACRANGLVFMVVLGATGFSLIFRELGGDELMLSVLYKLGIDTPWSMLIFVMILIFLRDLPDRAAGVRAHPRQAGFFRAHWRQDVVHAVVRHIGGREPADLVHVAAVRRQLFYMKGTVPPECSMTDVYRGMYPFLIIQIIGLFLCLSFPSLSLWLPKVAGLLD